MPRIIADRWSPCPQGELDRLETTLRAGRLRQTLFAIVLVAATALAVGATSYTVADAFWSAAGSSESQQCPPCAPAQP